MKKPTTLLLSALAIHAIHAAPLTDADREALLGNLQKLRDSAVARTAEKNNVAIAAFRAALSSDDRALELYLNCVEKVNYGDQQRKPQEFRDWRRKETDKLKDPAFRTALRCQLAWLTLTLQAAAENPNLPKLAAEAATLVDSIFRDSANLASQEQLLSQPVTASIFAHAYDIHHIKVENWPLSPTQLDNVYDQIFLPPLRNPDQLPALQNAWLKRIEQERLKREFWGGGRGGPNAAEADKFLTETAPQLQWQMEKDLFRAGDQSGAAVRMLAHLEKYIRHPSARQWGDELRAMLTPKTPG